MTYRDSNVSTGSINADRVAKPEVEMNIYNLTKENLNRIVDEAAKIQPRYAQSLSNIQLDYIQSIKNAISTAFYNQKQIANTGWSTWDDIFPKNQFAEHFAKQSQEITRNVTRALNINNQLTINALEVARENLKIYNKTIDAISEFNANTAKAWNLLLVIQRPLEYRTSI